VCTPRACARARGRVLRVGRVARSDVACGYRVYTSIHAMDMSRACACVRRACARARGRVLRVGRVARSDVACTCVQSMKTIFLVRLECHGPERKYARLRRACAESTLRAAFPLRACACALALRAAPPNGVRPQSWRSTWDTSKVTTFHVRHSTSSCATSWLLLSALYTGIQAK